MTSRLPSLAVMLTLLATVAAVAWWGGALGWRAEPRTFNLTGVGSLGRWTLEPVTGLTYAWKDFAPATLFVETGDDVVIHLRSADVFHRFYLPEFAVGPVDVEPGHTATVRFRASRAGVFQFYCTSMCGACHFQMRGWLVVTDPGDEPVIPPTGWTICIPHPAGIPEGTGLVDTGRLLFEQKGCVTCHGPRGRGGVSNVNSTNGTAPAHDTTALKLLLRTREDADAFIVLLERTGDLDSASDTDIAAFPIVRTRFLNARAIIRGGRFTARANPAGPQPPLQMPAWQYLLEERQIDALLAYFVSLQDWSGEEGTTEPFDARDR